VVGGVQQAMKSIIDCTPEFEHKVLVTSETGTDTYYHDGTEVINCKSYGNLFSMPISPAYFFKVITLAKEFDLVCVHYPFPLSELALLFAKAKNLIYFWHSDIVSQKRTKQIVYPFIKIALKKAKRVFISYPDMAKNSDILNIFEAKTIVCPYSVQIDESNESKDETTENYGKYILSVGRLVPYKGFKYLIEAMKGVKDLNLVICGNGPLKSELDNMITNSNMQNRVFLLDNISDENLKVLYRNCEFYVFPSCMQSEAFGIAMLESMSFGKAVINTKLDTGVNWVARDGSEAITVPPCDSASLCSAINMLHADVELKTKLCNNSLMRVKQMFMQEHRQTILKNEFNAIINRERS
jgi:rhamnosyl/mannosyltransferase